MSMSSSQPPTAAILNGREVRHESLTCDRLGDLERALDWLDETPLPT
jgi:hypothetical protein